MLAWRLCGWFFCGRWVGWGFIFWWGGRGEVGYVGEIMNACEGGCDRDALNVGLGGKG